MAFLITKPINPPKRISWGELTRFMIAPRHINDEVAARSLIFTGKPRTAEEIIEAAKARLKKEREGPVW